MDYDFDLPNSDALAGEIPYIPTESNQTTIDQSTQVFTTVGEIIAPFTMLEITGEQKFSDFGATKHIYISNMPMFDGQYWFFVLDAPNVLDKSQLDDPFFHPNEIMTDTVTSTYYFGCARKPLYISRINLNNRYSPMTYLSRQLKTGEIPTVYISDLTDTNGIFDVDTKTADLTTDEIDNEMQFRIDNMSDTAYSAEDHDDEFDITDIYTDEEEGSL